MLHEHSKTLKNHSKSLKSLKENQITMLDMLYREQMNQRSRPEEVER
jgi:hypothetical protein